MERKEILFVLVLAGLMVAGVAYVQFFYAPTVDTGLTEPALAKGAGGTDEIPTVVINESEETETHNSAWLWNEIPEGTEWQRFVDETRVEWIYNSAGEKVGGIVFVGKEPLHNDSKGFRYGNGTSFIDYLKNYRDGGCAYSFVPYRLFEAKGEKVKLVKARNVNYNPDPERIGSGHVWIEWTDKTGEQFVIDHGRVWTAEKWSRFNWTERKVWTAGNWETI